MLNASYYIYIILSVLEKNDVHEVGVKWEVEFFACLPTSQSGPESSLVRFHQSKFDSVHKLGLSGMAKGANFKFY